MNDFYVWCDITDDMACDRFRTRYCEEGVEWCKQELLRDDIWLEYLSKSKIETLADRGDYMMAKAAQEILED